MHVIEPLMIVEVLAIDPTKNHLRVRIYPIAADRTTWEEDWNLEHTYAGFTKRAYRMLENDFGWGPSFAFADDIDPKLKERAEQRRSAYKLRRIYEPRRGKVLLETDGAGPQLVPSSEAGRSRVDLAVTRMRTEWTATSKIVEKDGSVKMEYIEDLCAIVDDYMAQRNRTDLDGVFNTQDDEPDLSKLPWERTPTDNFVLQANVAAATPPPLPPGAKPLGTGALADCFTVDVDYSQIELRLLAWGEEQVRARSQRLADLLEKMDEILALLPIPTDERMADHPPWMQQVIPLTGHYVAMKRELNLDPVNPLSLSAAIEELAKHPTIPPGYSNYYTDGIVAHNQGRLPETAPLPRTDQRITLAWLRGWSSAYDAARKHKPQT